MQIKDATAKDWPGIWAVMEPIVRAGETYTWDTDASEAALRAAWLHGPAGDEAGALKKAAGRARTFVAVIDGEVAGTAELHPNYGGGASDVANAGFMVGAGHQGRGVARALGEHVLAAARDLGYSAMVFNAVVESNTRAVGLWQSLGFRVVGTIPGAFRRPDGERVGLHVMHRSLRADG